MSYIHADFLLQSKTAQSLYHEYAAAEPILDYHSHLPAEDIAKNRQFRDLAEIWLAGDHYKWRAMRANGIEERYCTGEGAAYEKFLAWARTVPQTLRNPLYQWTHLELKRHFDIDLLLSEDTATEIWRHTAEQLATPALATHGILDRFKVKAVCTTDDPTDDLAHHQSIRDSKLSTRVYPTFRPDRALQVDDPPRWNHWVTRLEQVANVSIRRLDDLLAALRQRHQAFHALGCRLSDHGLPYCYAVPGGEMAAAAVFDRCRRGQAASPTEHSQFASFLMLEFGRWDAAAGWTKQLHLGALRNTNTRNFQQLGPDSGFDTIGDWPQVNALVSYLDQLDRENVLPRMILYNNNPRDNYLFATAIGCFQDGSVPGKIQFGSGWWHLDQKEGMEWQINALSNVGLLSRSVGMLTDSRSFLSFPRHEYFRRVLCNLVGSEVERGELPNDRALVGGMIRNICYANARDHLRLAVEPDRNAAHVTSR